MSWSSSSPKLIKQTTMSPSPLRYTPNAFASMPTTSLSSATESLDVHQELLDSLARINTFTPPVQTCSTGWKFAGFYSGPTSIAYLFYRLSVLYPDMMFEDQSLEDWCMEYLKLGSKRLEEVLSGKKAHVDASHCGIANETLCQLVLRMVLERDVSRLGIICGLSKIINATQAADSEIKEASNEWLYGRAGYLYLLRLLWSAFGDQRKFPAFNRKLLLQTIDQTIETILATPLPWTWQGKAYIGAAHGDIGIITQIVLSLNLATKPRKHAKKLETQLLKLLDTQFPSGNFPSSISAQSPDDRRVQFCHGGPGFVVSLETMLPYFQENATLSEKIDEAIKKSREDIWRRGIIARTSCLCHGIAGNALAFLPAIGPSFADSDTAKLRFRAFLSQMTTEQLEADDDSPLTTKIRDSEFSGLYVGEAGRAWVWSVADSLERDIKDGMEEAGVLGKNGWCIAYNDL